TGHQGVQESGPATNIVAVDERCNGPFGSTVDVGGTVESLIDDVESLFFGDVFRGVLEQSGFQEVSEIPLE
ncbi:hypothetical protein WICPIJ_006400, partial [Wickerhamomyces pijperi]